MLERISDLPDGVLGLRASGTVAKDDYDRVVEPLLDEARRDGRRIRFLYHLTPAFTGFTAGGAWEDARVGMHYLRLFERCAVVTDKDWIRGASRVIGALLPCPVKAYEETQYAEAVAWLASPTAAKNVAYRLIEDRGVLLVEPHAKLSVEDFDAIALTVDSWIENGHDLYGIVVHTRSFPGWETIGSFLRHVQFVRDHHKKVRRIAVSADGSLRAANAADTIGALALLVHAKDDDAKGFYEHVNFEPSPSDPYHLMLIMKDLVRIVRE